MVWAAKRFLSEVSRNCLQIVTVVLPEKLSNTEEMDKRDSAWTLLKKSLRFSRNLEDSSRFSEHLKISSRFSVDLKDSSRFFKIFRGGSAGVTWNSQKCCLEFNINKFVNINCSNFKLCVQKVSFCYQSIEFTGCYLKSQSVWSYESNKNLKCSITNFYAGKEHIDLLGVCSGQFPTLAGILSLADSLRTPCSYVRSYTLCNGEKSCNSLEEISDPVYGLKTLATFFVKKLKASSAHRPIWATSNDSFCFFKRCFRLNITQKLLSQVTFSRKLL